MAGHEIIKPTAAEALRMAKNKKAKVTKAKILDDSQNYAVLTVLLGATVDSPEKRAAVYADFAKTANVEGIEEMAFSQATADTGEDFENILYVTSHERTDPVVSPREMEPV